MAPRNSRESRLRAMCCDRGPVAPRRKFHCLPCGAFCNVLLESKCFRRQCMEKELQVLIVEDDPVDALRLVHEFARHGIECQSTRVETEAEFLRSMEQHLPD